MSPASSIALADSCSGIPTVNVGPAALGDPTTISGMGYACGAQLSLVLTVGNVIRTPRVIQVTANATGAFSTTYTVTCGQQGSLEVNGLCITDSGDVASLYPFTVTVYDIYAQVLVSTPVPARQCSIQPACGQDFTVQDALAPAQLEQRAEQEIADLRGVPNDAINANWSRGEIRAAKYLDLLQLVNQCHTSCSPTDQAIVDYYADAVHQQRVAVANEALKQYNIWKVDPCVYHVPVGDPSSYLAQTDVASGPSAPCNIPANSLACLLGACTPKPPAAGAFTSWAEGEILNRDFASWGAELQSANPSFVDDAKGRQEAAVEYNTAFGGFAEGVAYLHAKHGELGNVSARSPTTDSGESAAGADLQEAWFEVLGERAKDDMQDLVSNALTSLIDPEVEWVPYADGLDQLVPETLADLVADGDLMEIYDTIVGPALAAGVIIGYEIWQLVENVQVQVDLTADQSSVQADKTEPLYDNLFQASPSDAATERMRLLDALIRSTMPDFSVNRLNDPRFVPAPSGPAQLSDPVFTIEGDGPTAVTSSFRVSGRSDTTKGSFPAVESVQVSGGWFTHGGGPYYSSKLDYVNRSGEYWRAWLDGPAFLQERWGVPVGTGAVGDATNGICNYEQVGVNSITIDTGATCVYLKSSLTLPLQKGDEIEIDGQVRTLVSNSSSDTQWLMVDQPFVRGADGEYPTDTIILLTQPDANCFSDSSLGSRVTGPDCVSSPTLTESGQAYDAATPVSVTLHYVHAADETSVATLHHGKVYRQINGDLLADAGPTASDQTTLNTIDLPAGNVTFSVVSGAGAGRLRLSSNGTFNYRPNPGFAHNRAPPACVQFPVPGTDNPGYTVCGGATAFASDSFVYKLCYAVNAGTARCSYARASIVAGDPVPGQ
jgi:hypothetical protein